MTTPKVILIVLFVLSFGSLYSQVRPHHIFDNNMVLQRDQPVKIWGWANPSERVKIEFGGQVKSTQANQQGEWFTHLDPMKANTQPQDMKVSGKVDAVIFSNVLVGDIWVLGGQSNMEMDLSRIFHGDAEVLSANFPNIRLMTIPSSAGHLPKKDFERINEYDSWNDRYDKKGYWFACSPSTVATFSGLGYIFGRRIHLASQIPIGLIDASLGGTTVEAWLSPTTLNKMPENKALVKQWNDKEAAYDPVEDLKTKITNWEKRSLVLKSQGLEPAPKPVEPSVRPSLDRNFPGSSYTGMVAIIGGLTVKGVLFHQGYNNALGDSRPALYALNYKALINDWRALFNNKNLPFGVMELSAGGEPQTLDNYELRMLDPAPYIREGQFNAYRDLPNTGYAAAYDQQVNWYHPQKKAEVGERMARWALSTQYGFKLGWEPAIYKSIERLKDRIIVTFSKEVKSSDDRPLEGFSIAGPDQHFYPAKAEYVKLVNEKGQKVNDKKRVVVWNDLVVDPVELRYAWARNPLGNLVNDADRIIPVPLFRTDQWEYPDAPYLPEEVEAFRQKQKLLQRKAEELAQLRIIQEAEKLLKEKKK
ncbi:MAG: sialate O-acetylesterase [bacterium]|jgi:sialate O-acetylesterase